MPAMNATSQFGSPGQHRSEDLDSGTETFMAETARELVHRMLPDVDAVTWGAEEVDIDLKTKYQPAILEVGAVPFVAELFRHLGDATLRHWLNALEFVWEPFPFSAWRLVLHRVASDPLVVYRLVWSAANLLCVDMVRAILDDPEVDPLARDYVASEFPRGPPRMYDGSTGEQVRLPYNYLWRRMAAEGAPMLYDDPT